MHISNTFKWALCPLIFTLTGCLSSTVLDDSADTASGSTTDTVASTETDTTTDADPTSNDLGGVSADDFLPGGLSEDISIVDCTLSSGVETTCYQVVTIGIPADATIGPFCPRHITDTADTAGIWFDGSDGEVHDLDGDFIANLATHYGDVNWQLFDVATGDVFYTETFEGCNAAARPDVDPAYQNMCVECSLADVGGGVSATYLIPTTPVPLETPIALGASDVGVSLSGIPIALPAPVADILANYTIAAFDDCGGHINPVAGYHYHAATGCSEDVVQTDGHAALIGVAMDGYGIYALRDAAGAEPEGLDDCRGQTDDVRGYHYHAASAGENMFIGCYRGDTVAGEAVGRPGGGGPGAGGPPPDNAPAPDNQ